MNLSKDNSNLPVPPKRKLPYTADKGTDPAVTLIRHKIHNLYSHEPSAKKELAEAEAAKGHRSKHQQFMHQLGSSGKSLAEIQTAWHNYYVGLPNHEKHEVWQEFYSTNMQSADIGAAAAHQPVAGAASANTDPRSVADVKRQLASRVQGRAKMRPKDHVHSLLFGMGSGAIVLLILLFGFFNERFIAPFITPSRSVSNTPLIIDPTNTAVDNRPKVIIPKINVEVPVIYDEPSIEEKAVQNALESGVLHYATTPNPGETGNGVLFGHSSSNILNSGRYKFAFVLLKKLETGDTFMLQKDGKRYVYRVYEKKVVKPDDLSVLAPRDKPSTFTLITCDPPGTSINRLVVVGEQISPDPNLNIASKVNQTAALKPPVLPSNSESLWHRLTQWLSS